jgi:hypothetical protein
MVDPGPTFDFRFAISAIEAAGLRLQMLFMERDVPDAALGAFEFWIAPGPAYHSSNMRPESVVFQPGRLQSN